MMKAAPRNTLRRMAEKSVARTLGSSGCIVSWNRGESNCVLASPTVIAGLSTRRAVTPMTRTTWVQKDETCTALRRNYHHKSRPFFLSSSSSLMNNGCHGVSNNHKKIIDLRSDTVTRPSPAMLDCALHASLGDDVLGEDPTVRELEHHVATNMFNKSYGLFVPTGTMSNLCALSAHGHERSSEIIIGSLSHISMWEGGNSAGLAGVHSRQIAEDPKTAQLPLQDVQDAIRDDMDDHFAKTAGICLENTHNMLGGVALSKAYVDSVGILAREHGVKLHIDGARIFNAAKYLQQRNEISSVAELCSAADTVSICLSKGLGTPQGSVLVSNDAETIRLAKRARKRCGGGMRQSGVIAAMCLYAVRNNIERLIDDHYRAKKIAEELHRCDFYIPRDGQIDTNILFFGLPESCHDVDMREYVVRLDAEYGIKISTGYSRGGRLSRIVTHMDVFNDVDESEDISYVTESLVKLSEQMSMSSSSSSSLFPHMSTA